MSEGSAETGYNPGDRVRSYQIKRHIAGGGMGVLYKATHPRLDVDLALKVLRPDLRSRANLVDRFRNEALAASRLRDERLPKIFEVDQIDAETWFMVMEYLEGEDLGERLARGPIALDLASRIVLEVLEVLDLVHGVGIFHCDLKPSNLFLAESDLYGLLPKVLDFGVAHIAAIEDLEQGEVLGTPSYMAPEQALRHHPIGPWTDVFAMGVVLYECLVGYGKRPWTDGRRRRVQAYLDNVAPQPLSERLPDLPAPFVDAVMRALRLDPQERYHSAAEFADAISPFAAERHELHRITRPVTEAQSMLTTLASAGPRSPVSPSAPTQAGELVPRPIRRSPPISGSAPQPRRRQALRRRTGTSGSSTSPESITRLQDVKKRLMQVSRRGTGPALQLGGPQLQRGERRLVTVVWLEAELHSLGGEPLSSEDFEQLIAQVMELLTKEFLDRDGEVLDQPGEGFVAVFGYDQVREDDAERAVAAATAALERQGEISAALAEIYYSATVQLGVHSGFVVRRGASAARAVGGDTAATAKRLAESAPMNGLICTTETKNLLGGAFQLRVFPNIFLRGRDRPIECWEVAGPTWGAMGVEWVGTQPTPFVGRDDELARLQGLWQRRLAGDGDEEVGLIVGPAGVGKTRLVTELLTRLSREPRLSTEMVRTQPASYAPSALWTPFVRALLATLHWGGDPWEAVDLVVASLPQARAERLRRQDEVLRLLLGRDIEEEGPQAEPMGDRGESVPQVIALIVEGFTRAVAESHGGKPPILVLENLHRGDGQGLQLLDDVLDALPDDLEPRPLWLLTARDEQALAVPEGLRSHTLALGPLSSSFTRRLVRAIGGTDDRLSRDARRFVVERAGGNPLFVEELVGALEAANLAGASAERLEAFAPPTSLFGLILARVDALEPEQRQVLRLASVLGLEFESSLLEDVAKRLLPDESLGERLEQLERRGLLRRRIDVEGHELVAFPRSQLAAAVYGTIITENKRVLHRMAAEAVERAAGAEVEQQAARLLHHWRNSGDRPRTLRYARLAGRRAARVGAYAEAVEALTMAVSLGRGPEQLAPMVKAETLYDLATALVWHGQLQVAAGRAEQALAALASAEIADAALILRGRVCMLLAELSNLKADWEEASRRLGEAEDAFRRASRDEDAAEARCWRGFMLRYSGRADEGLALVSEGFETLKASSRLAATARAGHDLGNVLRDLGRHEDALEAFEVAIAAGDELRERGTYTDSLWGSLAARSGRALSLMALGRHDDAVADQRRVAELARDDQNQVARAITSLHLAHNLIERSAPGDHTEAAALLAEALHRFIEMGMHGRVVKCRMLQSKLAEAAGDMERARVCLEDAVGLVTRQGLDDEMWLDAVAPLVRLLRAQGEEARASTLLREGRARAAKSRDARFEERLERLEAT